MLISPIIQSLKEIRSWLMKQDRSIASVNERVDAKDNEIKELNARLQKQNDRLTEQIQKQAKELEAIKKKLNL